MHIQNMYSIGLINRQWLYIICKLRIS